MAVLVANQSSMPVIFARKNRRQQVWTQINVRLFQCRVVINEQTLHNLCTKFVFLYK